MAEINEEKNILIDKMVEEINSMHENSLKNSKTRFDLLT